MTPDKRLWPTALGSFWRERGKWKLLIDPAQKYLVQEAHFYAEGGAPNQRFAVWKTEGLLKGSAIPVAQRTSWQLDPDEDRSESSRIWAHLEFVDFRLGFNTEWLNTVREKIFHPSPGTQVLDERVNPPKSYMYGS